VTELREEGFISDLFFKSDKSGPILVLYTPTATRRSGALRPCRGRSGILAFEQLIEFD